MLSLGASRKPYKLEEFMVTDHFVMMRPFCALVCAILCGSVSAKEDSDFVQDLKGRGLDVGGGLIVHLDKVETRENASLFERHALSFDYGGVGLRFGKAEDQDALKIGIYYGEGRGRKNKLSEMILPALLGYKTSTMVVLGLSFVAMMVMKALMLAKVALVAAAVISIMAFYHKGEDSKHTYANSVELEHDPSEMHSVYTGYEGEMSESGGYSPSASAQVLAYSAHTPNTGFVPSSSQGQSQYSYLDVPLNNTSGAIQIVQKRRDFNKKPQPLQAYITIKRKSIVRH